MRAPPFPSHPTMQRTVVAQRAVGGSTRETRQELCTHVNSSEIRRYDRVSYTFGYICGHILFDVLLYPFTISPWVPAICTDRVTDSVFVPHSLFPKKHNRYR
jgi:hypothetical protein